MKRIKAYEHRQYVILSTLLALFLLAFAFNRFVFNRSTVLINLQYENVVVTVDGQTTELEKIDEDTYKFITTPGRHTISISSGTEVNHKEVIQALRGRAVQITPTLTLSSTPASDVVGQASFLSYDESQNTLYFLGRDLTTLVRYNLDSGEKVAISDPIFRQNHTLEWVADHRGVITKDDKNIWYFFDFTKLDFVSSQFKLLANPNVLDIKYDEAHDRLGFIEYRDDKPIFGEASVGMQNKNVLAILDKISAPNFVWSTLGTKIAITDDPLYNKANLFIYDLATDSLASINAKNVSRTKFSQNDEYLLVEENETALPVLLVINPISGEKKELLKLAVKGAFLWHNDSEHITALTIADTGESQLIKYNLKTGATQKYESSPNITSLVENIYLTNNEKTLHFVSNNTLYSFPLTISAE